MPPRRRLDRERSLRRWLIVRQQLLRDPLRRRAWQAERARLLALLEAADKERGTNPGA